MTTVIPHAYGIYASRIQTVAMGANPIVLNQITDTPLEFGAVIGGEADSGNVYPQCLFLQDLRPTSQLVTRNVVNALTILGSEGLAITSDGTHPGIEIFAQRLSKLGKRASSGHKSYVVKNGLAVPRTLVANRESATITYDVIAVEADSGGSPVVVVEGVTLPTPVTVENHFVLDKVTVGGVVLSGQTDISLNFGVNVDVDKTAGHIFPNWAHIDTVVPELTITGFDVDWIRPEGTDLSIFGKGVTHLDTVLYLRKRVCGGTFVADAVSDHIRIAMAGYIVPRNTMQGRPKTQSSFMIRGKFDSDASPLIFTLGSAIA